MIGWENNKFLMHACNTYKYFATCITAPALFHLIDLMILYCRVHHQQRHLLFQQMLLDQIQTTMPSLKVQVVEA